MGLRIPTLLLLTGILFILNQPATSKDPRDTFKEFVEKARVKCRAEAGLKDEDDLSNPPIIDNGKCCPFCACWVNEIGYMSNGTWDRQRAKEVNRLKWRNPENAEKNDRVDEICFARVPTKGRKECESALEYRDCKRKLFDEIQTWVKCGHMTSSTRRRRRLNRVDHKEGFCREAGGVAPGDYQVRELPYRNSQKKRL